MAVVAVVDVELLPTERCYDPINSSSRNTLLSLCVLADDATEEDRTTSRYPLFLSLEDLFSTSSSTRPLITGGPELGPLKDSESENSSSDMCAPCMCSKRVHVMPCMSVCVCTLELTTVCSING